MEAIELSKMIAKERYELELMTIELKRMIELDDWNKKHLTLTHKLNEYNDKTLKIKIDIQHLKIDLQNLDLEYLISKLNATTC
jgi:hypothetical protein